MELVDRLEGDSHGAALVLERKPAFGRGRQLHTFASQHTRTRRFARTQRGACLVSCPPPSVVGSCLSVCLSVCLSLCVCENSGAGEFLSGCSCGALVCLFAFHVRLRACVLFVCVRSFSQEMEQLKASVRSKSDIDFLRKTLRQNYDRFISEGAGRVR